MKINRMLLALVAVTFSTVAEAAEGGEGDGAGGEYLSETWIAVTTATREGRSKETCHIVIIPKILISNNQQFAAEEAMRLAKEEYSPKRGWRNHKASIHHAEEAGNEIRKGSCLVNGRSIEAGG